MLIYLDNSDISWLERMARQDVGQFRSLVTEWRESGCEFAFSFHHVQETAQLADPPSVEARLSVIAEFGRIRFARSGALEVVELEIEAQLLALASNAPPNFSPVRDALFPQVSPSVFQNMVRADRQELQKHRSFLEACTDASNTLSESDQEFHKTLADAGVTLPKNAPVDFDWDDVWGALEAEWVKTEGAVPPRLTQLGRLLGSFHTAAKREGSARGGLEAVLGLKDVAVINRVSDRNLVRVASFFLSAREIAADLASHLNVSPHLFLGLVSKLNPHDCPGFRLQLAVERARLLTADEQATSDLVDVEHVAFAPYVDIMFVDKRTKDYARREIGDGPGKLVPEEVTVLQVGGSLEKVGQAILKNVHC